MRSLFRSAAICTAIGAALTLGVSVPAFAGAAPAPGDIIINEYISDDYNGADYVELLTLKAGLNIQGLRISDNELTAAQVWGDANESAIALSSTETGFDNLPAGTRIVIWTGAAATATTDLNGADGTIVVKPGAGAALETGCGANSGFATAGDAIYVFLPGPDGGSGCVGAGAVGSAADNVYLDFLRYETGQNPIPVPPTGLADIDLPSLADNAYYCGITAAGNDVVANWVRYDGPTPVAGQTTPGLSNGDLACQNLAGVDVPVANYRVAVLFGALGLGGAAALAGRRRLGTKKA